MGPDYESLPQPRTEWFRFDVGQFSSSYPVTEAPELARIIQQRTEGMDRGSLESRGQAQSYGGEDGPQKLTKDQN